MKKRAKFNLSNFHNCTFKMGVLYPTNLMEVLPGDTVQLNSSVFMRLAPMVAPVMHPVHMFMHHFFVPSRLLWENFESFITGGSNGNNADTIPQAVLNATNSPAGTLADAFGLPVQMLKGNNTFSVNALPFFAYYDIWNNYYRDQDLQSEVNWQSYGTPWTSSSALNLLQPCWSKDYFTTSRPWPQKGPQVTIPIDLAAGGDPTLTFTGELQSGTVLGSPKLTWSGSIPNGKILHAVGDSPSTIGLGPSSGPTNDVTTLTGLYVANKKVNGQVSYNAGSLGTGAISVDDVRQAFALQRFEEHRALFGHRYEDYLRYLGVRPQDSRLQMPEYLGGFTSPVQFSEVIQTGGEAGGIGDLYGHGIAAARGRRVRRFIPEHGYIMSLLCVRPIPVYAQGIERLWNKTTKEDFWQKELEHIGQQEVLNKEVYADGTNGDANTFGFQNRYDEYRRGVNVVTGEFRTNQDFWTMARIFENRPALNADFVECNPTDRIFQVNSQNSDQCYCMVKNNVIARRLISKNGNPI